MIAIGKGMYGDCLKDMSVFFVFVFVCSFIFFLLFHKKRKEKVLKLKREISCNVNVLNASEF